MSNCAEPQFDKFADNYRDIHKENIKNLSEFDSNYFAEYKVKIVKDSLEECPKNILDFGCGDGISCEFFRKYFPDSTITGIDVSSESIKIAENKQIQNSSFINYDGNKLPFESDSFDVIFVACVFHHIAKQNHKSLIHEFRRVLKKGGRVFIFEHNPLNPLTRKVVKDCVFDKDAELIYAKSFKKMAVKLEFRDIKINYTLFFPRFNIFKKCFPFEKNLKWCTLGAQYYIEARKD